MSQPIEYFVWVRDSNGMSYHGLKAVTRKRGEKLVAEYNKKLPLNFYWLEPVEPVKPVQPPHAKAMLEKAQELWMESRHMLEEICDSVDAPDTMTLFRIEDLQNIAIDLKHYASWPVEFALPPGECACKLPEESCQFCQPHTDELELI